MKNQIIDFITHTSYVMCNIHRQRVMQSLTNDFPNHYFARNIPHQQTEGICTTLDSAIEKLMGQCFNLKNEEIFNKIRMHLSIRLGGLEVRELCHVGYAEFIGGIMDGISHLLSQTHDDGTFYGKLNKLSMKYWIGKTALWLNMVSGAKSSHTMKVL